MFAQMNDTIVREFRQEFDENREPMTIEYATQRLRIALDRARAAQSGGAGEREAVHRTKVNTHYGVEGLAVNEVLSDATERRLAFIFWRDIDAMRPAGSLSPRAEAAPRGTPRLGLEGLRATVQSLLDACEPGTLRMHKLRHERFDNEPGYWLTEEYVEFLCARWQETHHDLAMSAAAPRAPEPSKAFHRIDVDTLLDDIRDIGSDGGREPYDEGDLNRSILEDALGQQADTRPRASEPEAGDNVQARTCPWCGKGPQVYGKTDVRCRDAKCPGHVHWRSIEAWNSCAPPRASEDGEVAKSPSVVYDAPRSATPGDGLDGSGVSQPPREADPRPALLSAQAFHAALMARYQAECEACSRCQGFGATAAATNHAVRAVTFLESANLVAAYEFDAGQLQPLTAAEFAEFPVQGRPPHDAPPSSAVKETGRVETGVVQFDDDWPGVFIRGDNAVPYGLKLTQALKDLGDRYDTGGLRYLSEILVSCDTRTGGSEKAQKIRRASAPAPSDVSADEVERVARELFDVWVKSPPVSGETWEEQGPNEHCAWQAMARYALTHRSVAAKVPSVRRPIGEYVAAYNRAYRERMEWFTTTNVEVAPGIKGAAIDVNVCVRAGVKAVLALSLPRAPAKEASALRQLDVRAFMEAIFGNDYSESEYLAVWCYLGEQRWPAGRGGPRTKPESPRSAVEAEVVERVDWLARYGHLADAVGRGYRSDMLHAYLVTDQIVELAMTPDERSAWKSALARAQEGRGT